MLWSRAVVQNHGSGAASGVEVTGDVRYRYGFGRPGGHYITWHYITWRSITWHYITWQYIAWHCITWHPLHPAKPL